MRLRRFIVLSAKWTVNRFQGTRIVHRRRQQRRCARVLVERVCGSRACKDAASHEFVFLIQCILASMRVYVEVFVSFSGVVGIQLDLVPVVARPCRRDVLVWVVVIGGQYPSLIFFIWIPLGVNCVSEDEESVLPQQVNARPLGICTTQAGLLSVSQPESAPVFIPYEAELSVD